MCSPKIMAEQKELTWTVENRHKPNCIRTAHAERGTKESAHSTFINFKRKNENYCILSLSGIFISSYVRFSLSHSCLSAGARTIPTLITIPIFTSAFFFVFVPFRTDSASRWYVIKFSLDALSLSSPHTLDCWVRAASGQCVFFIRCVMAAIKIKQLLLYILCHVYYCCLLSIAWPMRYSICALFVIRCHLRGALPHQFTSYY